VDALEPVLDGDELESDLGEGRTRWGRRVEEISGGAQEARVVSFRAGHCG